MSLLVIPNRSAIALQLFAYAPFSSQGARLGPVRTHHHSGVHYVISADVDLA